MRWTIEKGKKEIPNGEIETEWAKWRGERWHADMGEEERQRSASAVAPYNSQIIYYSITHRWTPQWPMGRPSGIRGPLPLLYSCSISLSISRAHSWYYLVPLAEKRAIERKVTVDAPWPWSPRAQRRVDHSGPIDRFRVTRFHGPWREDSRLPQYYIAVLYLRTNRKFRRSWLLIFYDISTYKLIYDL